MTSEEQVLTRRRLLGRVSLALSGLAAAVVSVPIVAYLLSPLLQPPPEVWRDLGLVDNFRIGETVEVAYDEPSPLPWAGQLPTARTAARELSARDMSWSRLAGLAGSKRTLSDESVG